MRGAFRRALHGRERGGAAQTRLSNILRATRFYVARHGEPYATERLECGEADSFWHMVPFAGLQISILQLDVEPMVRKPAQVVRRSNMANPGPMRALPCELSMYSTGELGPLESGEAKQHRR